MSSGQIGISDVVYDNVKSKEGVKVVRIGERALKNVANPVVLYLVEA